MGKTKPKIMLCCFGLMGAAAVLAFYKKLLGNLSDSFELVLVVADRLDDAGSQTKRIHGVANYLDLLTRGVINANDIMVNAVPNAARLVGLPENRIIQEPIARLREDGSTERLLDLGDLVKKYKVDYVIFCVSRLIANLLEVEEFGDRMFVLHHLGHSGGPVNKFLDWDKRCIDPIWHGGPVNEQIVRALKLGYVLMPYDEKLHQGLETVTIDELGRPIVKSAKIPVDVNGLDIGVVQAAHPVDAGPLVTSAGFVPPYPLLDQTLLKKEPGTQSFESAFSQDVLGIHRVLQAYVTELLCRDFPYILGKEPRKPRGSLILPRRYYTGVQRLATKRIAEKRKLRVA